MGVCVCMCREKNIQKYIKFIVTMKMCSYSVCVCMCVCVCIYIYIYIWPMAVKAWDPKHWAARIFPYFVYSFLDLIFIIKFPSYHIVFEIKF